MHDIANAAADAAQPPRFEEVRARGDRRRRRRQTVAAGAAALVVAGVVGVTQIVGGPGGTTEPGPAEDSEQPVPTGTAPMSVPYWTGGALHVGEVRIETDLRDVRYAGGTTVVGRPGGGPDRDWHLVVGDELVPISDSGSVAEVTVSPDGEVLAMVEHVSEDLRVLRQWDVERQETVASSEVPVEVMCCDQAGELTVQGVDLDHRVVFTTDRPWLWAPGTDPVPITGVDATAALYSQPWPGGMMIQDTLGTGGETPGGVFGTVSDDGEFAQVGLTPTDQLGLWSPDGARFVFFGEIDGVQVQAVDGTIAELPTGPGDWRPIAWESTEQVLLTGNRGYLRCDAAARVCDEPRDAPTGRVVWPAAGIW